MSENDIKIVEYSVKPKITFVVTKFEQDGVACGILKVCEVEREEQANAIIAALQSSKE